MKSWISIIIGFLVIFFGAYIGIGIFNNELIFVGFLLIAGFLATYLSEEKKQRTSIYLGLIFGFVTLIFIVHIGNQTSYSWFIVIISSILIPLFCCNLGGFIAKYWHLYLVQKKDLKNPEYGSNRQNYELSKHLHKNQPHGVLKNKIKDYWNILYIIVVGLTCLGFLLYLWGFKSLTLVIGIILIFIGLYRIITS
ncbi:hypothetical protein [uncultured Methanobacterium sp.]|uniref:hypothetical protein n=1 Tax=uncultured Methanobacterium sp. TaxID=176306 RepID=UPI002AA5F1F9|nr:hypothetical protein [uncultured Methanobacterium sp.]